MTKIPGKEHPSPVSPTSSGPIRAPRSLFSPSSDYTSDPDVQAALERLLNLNNSSFDAASRRSGSSTPKIEAPVFAQAQYGMIANLATLDEDDNDERVNPAKSNPKVKVSKAGSRTSAATSDETPRSTSKNPSHKNRR